jgi:hypothetical protein
MYVNDQLVDEPYIAAAPIIPANEVPVTVLCSGCIAIIRMIPIIGACSENTSGKWSLSTCLNAWVFS